MGLDFAVQPTGEDMVKRAAFCFCLPPVVILAVFCGAVAGFVEWAPRSKQYLWRKP